MENSFFYFNEDQELLIVEMDSQYPRFRQVKYFIEEFEPRPEGFGLLRFSLYNPSHEKMEDRHLVFGLTQKNLELYEYFHYNDLLYMTKKMIRYQPIKNFAFNSQILKYKDDVLLMIGGDFEGRGDLQPTPWCFKYRMSINERHELVYEEQVDFPELCKPRHSHCCFILNDYLFVVFGNQMDAEVINLKDDRADFYSIKIDKFQDQIFNAMLFTQTRNNEEKVYFFGG